MDQLLERLGDMKITKEQPSYNLSKTGFIYDSKLSEALGKDELTATLELFNKTAETLSTTCLEKCKRFTIGEESSKSLISAKGVTVRERASLASAIELLDNLVSGSIDNGMAFVSTCPKKIAAADQTESNETGNESSEFSLEATLAKMALDKHELKRILIVNMDLDHTTTTQQAVYDNPKILYFSVHRSAQQQESELDYIGENAGKGFNLNVPLVQAGFGNTEYMSILYNLLLPVAYEFNPEIVIISTCFNAFNKSSEGYTTITASLFAHFVHSFSCLADGKQLVLVNDKNLHENSFQECTQVCLEQLLGFPVPRIEALTQPKEKLVQTVATSVAILRQYWCCLQLLNDNDTTRTLDEHLENYKRSVTIKEESDVTKESESKETNELCKLLEDTTLSGLPSSRTSICSDEKMMAHVNLLNAHHPESPMRIKHIIETLKKKMLYERCGEIESRHANEDDIALCHAKQYIQRIRKLRTKSTQELMEMSHNPDSVYYHSETYDSACLAVGCVLAVVDSVCTNKSLNGAVVCRPPGHHANGGACSGFCFFNSIAIAAKYAQKNYTNVKKVLILDFDVHHGNGTQEIFKDDDSVLFISLHRYDDGNFYPVGSESNFNYVGGNKAKGFTVNVPWSVSSAGDAEYLAAFLRVVMPIAYQFAPDLVLVSAGFDAAVGDPLGGYKISPSGFGQMVKMLSSLARSRVIMALEGGYNLTSISESMSSCVSILLGDQCPSLAPINAKHKAYESIRNVISVMKNYWSCFQFDDKLPSVPYVKQFKSERALRNNGQSTEMPYTLRTRSKKTGELSPGDSNSSCSSIGPESTTASNPSTPCGNSTKTTASVAKKIVTPAAKATETTVSAAAASENIVGAAAAFTATASAEAFFIQDTDEQFKIPIIPFAVIPLSYCPHLEEIADRPSDEGQINAFKCCEICQDGSENWLCLTCFGCFCSRYVKGHMSQHFAEAKHPMALSFSDMSVWCYECDSYVNNERTQQIKKIAYESKFSEKL